MQYFLSTNIAVIATTVILFEAMSTVGVYLSIPLLPKELHLNHFARTRIPSSLLGWDAYDTGNPRPATISFPNTCVAAFGDSFTHSDEVTDENTWANILSARLGCNVHNYGVGGYGEDQAVAKYFFLKGKIRKASMVLVGIFEEMLRRNGAASWLFYDSQPASTLKPYSVLLNDKLVKFFPHGVKDLEGVKKYHQHDIYAAPYSFEFPFSFSLMKIVWESQISDDIVLRKGARADVYQHESSLRLENAILRELYEDRVGKVGFLIFPTPDQVKDTNSPPYQPYFEKLKMLFPNACVFDPFYFLKEKVKIHGFNLRAPLGHFNEEGNKLIADYLYNALLNCENFTSEPFVASLIKHK
jgi:hypothetical protein